MILNEENRKKKKIANSVTYTTGDILANIRHFNKCMGTDFSNPSTEEAKKAAEEAAKDLNQDLNAGADISVTSDGAVEAAGDVGGDNGGSSAGDGASAGAIGESLEEGVKGFNEISLLFKLCKEIGIETMGDLERFRKENPEDPILSALFKYRNELGDDFKIAELEKEVAATDDTLNEFWYNNLAKKIVKQREQFRDLGAKKAGMSRADYDNMMDSKIRALLDAAAKRKAAQNESLITEAKREVRRYFLRPQHIFCANRDELISALIQAAKKKQNCSVYSLAGLEDNDDIEKLGNNDIIYYFDDGILYDKNHVEVRDYDLKIKHEEKRKKVNIKNLSDAAKKEIYHDRMIEKLTEENELNLDFASVNAYGEICK